MTGSEQWRLGARADYAIRALAELASTTAPMTCSQIARARDIPRSFLTVILSKLGRAGLVHARRGRVGGYSLARPPADITVAEIVTAVDGERADSPAGAGDPYTRLRGQLVGVIEALTLADLLSSDGSTR